MDEDDIAYEESQEIPIIKRKRVYKKAEEDNLELSSQPLSQTKETIISEEKQSKKSKLKEKKPKEPKPPKIVKEKPIKQIKYKETKITDTIKTKPNILLSACDPPDEKATVWLYFTNTASLIATMKCLNADKLQSKEKKKDKKSSEHPLFEIVVATDNDSFTGLRAHISDAANCCAIIAKVYAQVFFSNEEDFEEQKIFKVSSHLLTCCIEGMDSTQPLILYRRQGSAEIYLKSSSCYKSNMANMPTLVIEETELNLYETVRNGVESRCSSSSIYCSSAELKQIATFATSSKAESIQYVLASVNANPTQQFFFSLISYDGCSYEQCLFSTTENTNGENRLVFKNMTSSALTVKETQHKYKLSDITVTYNQRLASDFFAMIINHVKTPQVALFLTNEKPFVVRTCIGDDSSEITFVLAPQLEPDDSDAQVFSSKFFS